MIVMQLTLLLATSIEGPAVDADQFARLIEAQAAPLEDLTFLYEGAMRWVGPGRILATDPDQFGKQFQGAYLYRREDGAALLDIYSKAVEPTSSVLRRKVSHLEGEVETLMVSTDAKPIDPSRAIRRQSGGLGSLSGGHSPHTIFSLGRLLSLENPADWGYQFQGWEDVDGHSCLRFQVNRARGQGESRNFERYWVDMERGGHPLRVEYYNDTKLSARVDRIVLAPMPLPDGSRYWLPVKGVMNGFEWEGEFHDRPVLQETMDVVNGSVLLNQGLPDAVFSVLRESAMPVAGELARLRREAAASPLAREYEAAPPATPVRNDPASVRERLETALVEADRQAEELEASSPARRSWGWTPTLQVAFGLLGVGLLGGIAYSRWRVR